MDTHHATKLVLGGVFAFAIALGHARLSLAQQGWSVPATAADEKSPLTASDDVIKHGKSVYSHNCQPCHGPNGKGDGPEGDPAHPPANLTDPARAVKNPDGVMFYKVWNGRKAPNMPAFKSRIRRDEAWAVIEYVKTLREPKP